MIFICLGEISESEKDFVNEVFLKMHKKMYRISFKKLKTKFDAEEAVAQTFYKIVDNIEKISSLPCPEVEPYCVVILKNEINNIFRQREKAFCTDDMNSFIRSDESYNTEEGYIKTLEKEKLLSYMNKLSEDEKKIINFRFVYEMSFREIAELLDIAEEAAKKRGQRVIRKLRSYYKGGEEIG